MTGIQLRDRMEEFGVRKGGPAFYQLMARLEDGGMVEGSYVKSTLKGQSIRERRYRISGEGRAAWAESRAFYLGVIGRLEPDGRLARA